MGLQANPTLHTIRLIACDGRHEKANAEKAQQRQTAPDGQLKAVAEDIKGS